MQTIVVARPPNWEVLRDTFKLEGISGLIFSWGDKIYLPDGGNLSIPLRAHESIHGERQLTTGVEVWWQKYLDDVEFRIYEEVLGHKREYIAFCVMNKDRNQRAVFLQKIAHRLAGPIYGNLLTVQKAKARILNS